MSDHDASGIFRRRFKAELCKFAPLIVRKIIRNLLVALTRNLVPDGTGRSEPKAANVRAKPYPLLTKPCNQLYPCK
jgi:hypothetical protein